MTCQNQRMWLKELTLDMVLNLTIRASLSYSSLDGKGYWCLIGFTVDSWSILDHETV